MREIDISIKNPNNCRFVVASNGIIEDTRPDPIPDPLIDTTTHDSKRIFIGYSKGILENETVIWRKTHPVLTLIEDAATPPRSSRSTLIYNL